MPKLTPNKKIQRLRTEAELRSALTAFCLGKPQISVPVAQDDDSNIILQDGIEELLEARQHLEDIRHFMAASLAKFTRR